MSADSEFILLSDDSDRAAPHDKKDFIIIPNSQWQKEGTFCALGMAGIKPALPALKKETGYAALANLSGGGSLNT